MKPSGLFLVVLGVWVVVQVVRGDALGRLDLV